MSLQMIMNRAEPQTFTWARLWCSGLASEDPLEGEDSSARSFCCFTEEAASSSSLQVTDRPAQVSQET